MVDFSDPAREWFPGFVCVDPNHAVHEFALQCVQGDREFLGILQNFWISEVWQTTSAEAKSTDDHKINVKGLHEEGLMLSWV